MTAAVPSLTIRLHKPADPSRSGGLEIIRADGSTEYQPSPPAANFMVHDLAHYAVETVLGRTDSFLALLARGHPLGRISDTASVRIHELPDDAKQTEIIVSILQAEFAGYSPVESDPETFNANIARACLERSLPNPSPVTPQQLDDMRGMLRQLLDRYSRVAPGGVLELAFPAPRDR